MKKITALPTAEEKAAEIIKRKLACLKNSWESRENWRDLLWPNSYLIIIEEDYEQTKKALKILKKLNKKKGIKFKLFCSATPFSDDLS